ncbi:hypothetical protein C7458_12117 [Williamsia muralis]|nr:hypothetical protein C7458_12117 [Williamsia marianensis]
MGSNESTRGIVQGGGPLILAALFIPSPIRTYRRLT